jgi:hypothetical protein
VRKICLFLALSISAAVPATCAASTLPSPAKAAWFAPGQGMTSLTFQSVSCLGTNNCTTVGWSDNAAGDQLGIRAISSPSGSWEQSVYPWPTTSGDQLSSVSCLPTGVCASVGVATNQSPSFNGGNPYQAGVLAFSGGSRSDGYEVVPPSNADVGHGVATKLTLDSISCTGAGSCVAVGSYSTSGGIVAPLVTDITASQANPQNDQPATEIALPANANPTTQFADLHSVTCSGVGYCQAVGWFTDASGNTDPMVASEVAGEWSAAAEVPGPTSTAERLDSISCTSTDDCEAAGAFVSGTGAEQPMVATETGGIWSAAAPLPLPLDAGSTASAGRATDLDSISCASTGNCEAVGGYVNTASSQEPLAETETNGSWGLTAGGITPPNNGEQAAGSQVANFNSVDCYASTSCMAVGSYVTEADTTQALYATLTPAQAGSIAIRAVKISGSKLTATLRCSGAAGAACMGALTLGAIEHMSGKRVTAITAAAKRSTRPITLGSSAYALDEGAQKAIVLTLWATGKQLLERYGKLHAALAVSTDGETMQTITKEVLFKALTPGRRK